MQMEQMSSADCTVRPVGKSSKRMGAEKQRSLSACSQGGLAPGPSGRKVLQSIERDFSLSNDIFLIVIGALPPLYPILTIAESVVHIGLRLYMVLIGFCARRTRTVSSTDDLHPLLSVMRNVTS